MRRSVRSRKEGTGLGFDSLIDVFMNVVGVLMITAVVLALSVSNNNSSADNSRSSQKQLPPKKLEVPTPEPARLVLPQAREVSTDPLYLLLDSEGIRPFNGDYSDTVAEFFSVTPESDSLLLQPILGRVMSWQQVRLWLRKHSRDQRHVMAAITHDGTRFYQQLHKIANEEGYQVGWMPHLAGQIRLGEGGRVGSTVQ